MVNPIIVTIPNGGLWNWNYLMVGFWWFSGKTSFGWWETRGLYKPIYGIIGDYHQNPWTGKPVLWVLLLFLCAECRGKDKWGDIDAQPNKLLRNPKLYMSFQEGHITISSMGSWLTGSEKTVFLSGLQQLYAAQHLAAPRRSGFIAFTSTTRRRWHVGTDMSCLLMSPRNATQDDQKRFFCPVTWIDHGLLGQCLVFCHFVFFLFFRHIYSCGFSEGPEKAMNHKDVTLKQGNWKTCSLDIHIIHPCCLNSPLLLQMPIWQGP